MEGQKEKQERDQVERDTALRADIGGGGDLGSWRGREQMAGGGERGNPREKGMLRPAPGPQIHEGRVLACLPRGHTFA